MENPVFMGFFDAGDSHDALISGTSSEVLDFTRRKTAFPETQRIGATPHETGLTRV